LQSLKEGFVRPASISHAARRAGRSDPCRGSGFAENSEGSEFVAEAEKSRMTLNPIPGTTLHNMIVEGLSMSAASKKSSSRFLRRREGAHALKLCTEMSASSICSLVLLKIEKFMSRKPRLHFPETVYHVISPRAGGEIPNNQSPNTLQLKYSASLFEILASLRT
jgi:hypothetical protein